MDGPLQKGLSKPINNKIGHIEIIISGENHEWGFIGEKTAQKKNNNFESESERKMRKQNYNMRKEKKEKIAPVMSWGDWRKKKRTDCESTK